MRCGGRDRVHGREITSSSIVLRFLDDGALREEEDTVWRFLLKKFWMSWFRLAVLIRGQSNSFFSFA